MPKLPRRRAYGRRHSLPRLGVPEKSHHNSTLFRRDCSHPSRTSCAALGALKRSGAEVGGILRPIRDGARSDGDCRGFRTCASEYLTGPSTIFRKRRSVRSRHRSTVSHESGLSVVAATAVTRATSSTWDDADLALADRISRSRKRVPSDQAVRHSVRASTVSFPGG